MLEKVERELVESICKYSAMDLAVTGYKLFFTQQFDIIIEYRKSRKKCNRLQIRNLPYLHKQ